MSDYLWEKDGLADAEVERLERLLSPLAYAGRTPRLPAAPRPRRARRSWALGGALALATLLLLLVVRPWRPGPRLAEVSATVSGGAARLPDRPVTGEASIPVGTWLETGPSRVRLQVPTGEVELAPATRARVVEVGPARQVVELSRGTLSARVQAPPRAFVVMTPHVTATDLGCAFELTVDDVGGGRLTVTEGRVALAPRSGVPSDPSPSEVVVGAGSACAFDARGIGTPAPLEATAPLPADRPHPRAERSSGAVQPHAEKHAPHRGSSSAPRGGSPSEHAPPARPEVAPAAASEKPAAASKRAPASGDDPSLKLRHDALKNLERSLPQ
jgi:hypothetical protein